MSKALLKVLSSSLQTTSQALSARGQNELSILQESAVQLLGFMLLDGKSVQCVEEWSAEDATKNMVRLGVDSTMLATKLSSEELALWMGLESSKLVLIKSVKDADDWQELPIMLQNFVSRSQMPCHLIIPIEQLTLDGDDRHRHVVQPVFVVMSRGAKGEFLPAFALATEEQRKRDPKVVQVEAAGHLEPYMRILYGGLVQSGQADSSLKAAV